MLVSSILSKLLFFGDLATQPDLHQDALTFLTSMQERGYSLPKDNEVLKIRRAPLPKGRAGLWTPPNQIFLSQDIKNPSHLAVFLRHELVHALVFKNCRMPLWAQEAVAMNESGELLDLPDEPLDLNALMQLKKASQNEFPPGDLARKALGTLIKHQGWPKEKCKISKSIQQVLGEGKAENSVSWRVIHLTSGRALQHSGAQNQKLFPGSLLKVPLAASLKLQPSTLESGSTSTKNTVTVQNIGYALAKSDGDFFLKNMDKLDRNLLRSILGKDSDVYSSKTLTGLRVQEESVKYTLEELTSILRKSFLIADRTRFLPLALNGTLDQSTLQKASKKVTELLSKHSVLVKTGTTRNSDSLPLTGTALLVWPARDPQYLAVIKQDGVAGFEAVEKNASLFQEWFDHYSDWNQSNILVKINHKMPGNAFEKTSNCQTFFPHFPGATAPLANDCGEFILKSLLKNSKSLREVNGILSAKNSDLLLHTDIFSYIDGVMEAEAGGELTGEARRALQAIVAYNGMFGSPTHSHANPKRSNLKNKELKIPLCSSTQCMVFRGNGKKDLISDLAGQKQVAKLVTLIKPWANSYGNWIPFSLGGKTPWAKRMAKEQLHFLVKEALVLAIVRERKKQGEVLIHLEYPGGRETLSCEVFRNRLKLYSCPESIHEESGGQAWIFSGTGEGHGLGFQLVWAQQLSNEGHSAEVILRHTLDPKVSDEKEVLVKKNAPRFKTF